MVNAEKRIREALEELANDTIKHFRKVMDSDLGVNPKTGENTLHDSDIYKEMEYDVYPNLGMVEVLINSYADYIDMGRMSHKEVAMGRFKNMKNNGFPPLKVLRDWAIKKGIPSDNKTLYSIGYSIAHEGIRPRPVFSYAWKDLDKLLIDYLQSLCEAILNDLTEYFNKK